MKITNPLKHLKDHHDSQKNDTLFAKVIQDIENFIAALDKNYYISFENAPMIWDIIRCIVESLLFGQTRRSQIILGLRGSGKTALVNHLKKAIDKIWADVKTFYFDAQTQIKPDLKEVREGIEAKKKILLIIDEAQDIYPSLKRLEDCGDQEKKKWKEYTEETVSLLLLIANTPSCVSLLTGSSQALRVLYRGIKHSDYYGVYHDLNDKKYTLRTLLSLKDSNSVIEFFKSQETSILREKAQELLDKYGGCPNSLLTRVEEEIIDWNSSTWNIMNTLKNYPNFLECGIATADINNIIKLGSENLTAENVAEIRYKLVDQGLLEEYKGVYFIACKRYLRDYDILYNKFYPQKPLPASTERYQRARLALEEDNIPKFLENVHEAMQNIPIQVFGSSPIRNYESFSQSILHILLYFIHPFKSTFTTETSDQVGRLDLYYENKFRHYIELKGPDHKDDAKEALDQVSNKQYYNIYPRSEESRKKPLILYGVKWSKTSESIKILLSAPILQETTYFKKVLEPFHIKPSTKTTTVAPKNKLPTVPKKK